MAKMSENIVANSTKEMIAGAPAAAPVERLRESTEQLKKIGGFKLIESAIRGAKEVNPETKARKNIFLTDPSKSEKRKALKEEMQIWIDLLKDHNETASAQKAANNKQLTASNLLKTNLKKAIEGGRILEQSYRSVALFFKNTEADKINNLSLLNASLEQVADVETGEVYEIISEEISSKYDNLDLSENYSILAIPGYLGNRQVVEKWAKMAYKNKVMMVTDFQDLEDADSVLTNFTEAKLTGGDAHLSNVVMASNWLIGRGRHEELGEEDDMTVPPSTALAGKMYGGLMSQVSAGISHGSLVEVGGVKFPMKKTEISKFDQEGVVPMVFTNGRVASFSAKTLYSNSDHLGMQTYSVVRVFDYIQKVLIDFLNRRAFENFNSTVKEELKSQIAKFLSNNTGPGKLIEDFKLLRLDRDPQQRDKINLDIHITPYFPAKTFLISLTGKKGEQPNTASWDGAVKQN